MTASASSRRVGDGATRVRAVGGASLRLVAGVAALSVVSLVALDGAASQGAQRTLLSLSVFFVLACGAYEGVRGVDPKLLELGRAAGLTAWSRWRDIVIPGALPAVLSSLRLALAVLWILLLVRDTLTGASSIGGGDLIWRQVGLSSGSLSPVYRVLLNIVLYAVLAKLADALVTALSRRVLRWQAATPPDIN